MASAEARRSVLVCAVSIVAGACGGGEDRRAEVPSAPDRADDRPGERRGFSGPELLDPGGRALDAPEQAERSPEQALLANYEVGDIEGPPQERLAREDVEGRSLRELRLLRSAIHAQHGREFLSGWIDDYMRAQDWYEPGGYSGDDLTMRDRHNLDLIGQIEEGFTLPDLRKRRDALFAPYGGYRQDEPLPEGIAETVKADEWRMMRRAITVRRQNTRIRLARARDRLPEEGCPERDALSRLSDAWDFVAPVAADDPQRTAFGEVAARVETCLRELATAERARVRALRREHRAALAEDLQAALTDSGPDVNEIQIDDAYRWRPEGELVRAGPAVALVARADRELGAEDAGRIARRIEQIGAGRPLSPGEIGVEVIAIAPARGDAYVVSVEGALPDAELAHRRLAKEVLRDPAWLTGPFDYIDPGPALEALCPRSAPCSCERVGAGGGGDRFVNEASAAVDLHGAEPASVAVTLAGCRDGDGRDLVVLSPEADAPGAEPARGDAADDAAAADDNDAGEKGRAPDAAWQAIARVPEAKAEHCEVVSLEPYRDNREALVCEARKRRRGTLYTSAVVVADLGGELVLARTGRYAQPERPCRSGGERVRGVELQANEDGLDLKLTVARAAQRPAACRATDAPGGQKLEIELVDHRYRLSGGELERTESP